MDDFNEFGDSWVIPGDPTCQPAPIIDPCEEGSEEYAEAQDKCYLLVLEVGQFSSCHVLLDPEPYYESCVYDLCATLPDDDLVCEAFEEYAQACRDAGGSPGSWRVDTPQCRKFV